MEQPPPGPDLEHLQNQPPKLNRRHLWLTLLLPGLLTALCTLGLFTLGSGSEETAFNLGCLIVAMTSIACWVGFAICINARFQGASRVLLILAYPIAQAVLVFVIFFAGCLVVISRNGFY